MDAIIDGTSLPNTLDTEAAVLREVGEDAVWTLSSAKSGNGIEQLRDNNLETFWQSGILFSIYPFSLDSLLFNL
jgi:hypothetical protein